MRLTAQEEYGLRCLLRLAEVGDDSSLTIPEISQMEGLSVSYVAKLMRILRRGGFVMSERGVTGGYLLAQPAAKMKVGEALAWLGGRLYDPAFCDEHAGMDLICAHATGCTLASLWRRVQTAVDGVLSQLTLEELALGEQQLTAQSARFVQLSAAQPVKTESQPPRAR